MKKGEPLQGKDYDFAPGVVFTREYRGEKHSVKVLDDGHQVEYRGETYRSISGVASLIVGHRESGYRFFNVKKRAA